MKKKEEKKIILIKMGLREIKIKDENPLKISFINLSHNKIRNLSSLKNFKNLKTLNLKKNNIVKLNQIFFLNELEFLENLIIEENPINDLVNFENFMYNKKMCFFS